VAIGNFDGVHLGHQAVLADTARIARAHQWHPIALTFDPHPTVTIGRTAPACLTPTERKVELIKKMDPALCVVVLPFDSRLAAQSPEEFVQTTLVEHLGATGVRVGENFRFGARRSGNLQTLRDFGAKLGFDVDAVPVLGDHHGKFSSTRARHAVAAGDLEDARTILSRPHSLSGTVVEGQQKARTLGFPTANLHWVQEALPPHGVYSVAVDHLAGNGPAGKLGLGVCSIGARPTLDAGFAVETHVFDFEGNLYGSRLRIHLMHRLRPEKKFASVSDLKAHIEVDARVAKTQLEGLLASTNTNGTWF